jgi:glycine/D-amino acid oxidase-like deaminating enzyme
MRSRRLRPPLPSRPSWWLEEARAHRPTESAPRLRGDLDVDVAIVGGGYTGLWTALALREREPSLSVALLEAREIGDGPSGRNGGFLHGYWSSLRTLRRVLGDGAALQLAHASARIVPEVHAFCERRGEDVWLREGGLLRVSAGESEDSGVENAVEAARDLGVEEEAQGLDAHETRQRCNSPRFRKAVYFRDGATVQPARLALALKRAAIDAAVELFEHTPVTGVAPGRLETPGGGVRAREIVLALNVWGTSWPLGGRQTNFGSAIVLTEPVPELLEEIGWTGGEAIVDGRMFLHYFRTTPDGRVLMGSGSGRLGLGDRVGPGILDDLPAQARAERGLRELLPALAAAPIAARWSGPIDVSADKLPRFGTVSGTTGTGTRLHYGAGYSGNGVGPSWLGGQILASLALGVRDEWTALPLVDRPARRLPPEPLRYVGGKLVRWGTLASEEAVAAGRRPPAAARAAAAIPRLLRMPIGTR